MYLLNLNGNIVHNKSELCKELTQDSKQKSQRSPTKLTQLQLLTFVEIYVVLSVTQIDLQ